jgi:hypothetical protein
MKTAKSSFYSLREVPPYRKWAFYLISVRIRQYFSKKILALEKNEEERKWGRFGLNQ